MEQRASVAVGLVHWPVLNQNKQKVTTSITHFDIHDIARACKVFGVQRYYIIHPLEAQREFVRGVLTHWREGKGKKFNFMRETALTDVFLASSLSEALFDWGEGGKVNTIATTAREFSNEIGFKKMRQILISEEKELAGDFNNISKFLLLFGTGFGLCDDVLNEADYVLEPIRGVGEADYRHLSVRSAVSICLDRLLGSW